MKLFAKFSLAIFLLLVTWFTLDLIVVNILVIFNNCSPFSFLGAAWYTGPHLRANRLNDVKGIVGIIGGNYLWHWMALPYSGMRILYSEIALQPKPSSLNEP